MLAVSCRIRRGAGVGPTTRSQVVHAMKFRFPIIIIDEDWRSDSASGLGIRALAKAIEDQGTEVVGGFTYFDVSMVANQAARASSFIVSIDDEEITEEGPESSAIQELRKFILETRRRNSDIPIFLFGETRTSQHIPNEILKELHGFIHMFEDTPEFVARYIIREATNYLNSLAPPFFKALVHYANDGSYSWHCPGHSGGVAFLKSPVGQMFHQFFGENMLRADVCNAVDELGQLLDHTGPVAKSEHNAARIFNADHLYFVTNGTSTSNKIVWHSGVARDDIVVVDRNCHKSILHAIMMTGTVPIFLQPTRNHLGIIGPIPLEEFSPESIRAKIDANPLVKDKTAKPRVLTITQSTYDGIVYNVETIKETLGDHVEILHFDEPGCPTRPSTRSITRCTRSASIGRAPRTRWCSPPSRRTSCLRAFRRRRRSWFRSRKAQAGPLPLQRSLPDAHLHLAAVRDHRFRATSPPR
jgi:arginine decarboxylase